MHNGDILNTVPFCVPLSRNLTTSIEASRVCLKIDIYFPKFTKLSTFNVRVSTHHIEVCTSEVELKIFLYQLHNVPKVIADRYLSKCSIIVQR